MIFVVILGERKSLSNCDCGFLVVVVGCFMCLLFALLK